MRIRQHNHNESFEMFSIFFTFSTIVAANKFKFVNQYSSGSNTVFISNSRIKRNCVACVCVSLLTTSCFWPFCTHTHTSSHNRSVKWVLQHHFYHKQSAYGDKSRWWKTTFSIYLNLLPSNQDEWINVQCVCAYTFAMHGQFNGLNGYIERKGNCFVKYLVRIESTKMTTTKWHRGK